MTPKPRALSLGLGPLRGLVNRIDVFRDLGFIPRSYHFGVYQSSRVTLPQGPRPLIGELLVASGLRIRTLGVTFGIEGRKHGNPELQDMNSWGKNLLLRQKSFFTLSSSITWIKRENLGLGPNTGSIWGWNDPSNLSRTMTYSFINKLKYLFN